LLASPLYLVFLDCQPLGVQPYGKHVYACSHLWKLMSHVSAGLFATR
jgi:hypothetical protein